MPIETTKYLTQSRAIYLHTINSKNGQVKESWTRQAKNPWSSKIYMAAYVSPDMQKTLEVEYSLFQGDDDDDLDSLRKGLEEIIVKGREEDYKELGGCVVALTFNNKIAFSRPVVKMKKS